MSARSAAPYRRKRMVHLFGTLCSLEAWGENERLLAGALESGVREMERISAMMNHFDAGSAISRINAAAGRGWQPAPRELCEALSEALRVSALTCGQFDATAGSVLDMWRSCAAQNRWPSEAECEEAAAPIGYRKVKVDLERSAVRIEDPRLRLDLSSIVKGYALDAASACMRAFPVSAVLLNAGGEILSWRADGQAVDVGLAHPDRRQERLGTIRLRQQAVATSGQGEPRMAIGGKAIGHLFDLRSGKPATSAIASVTAVAPTAWQADILATALFLTGGECFVRMPAEETRVGACMLYRRFGGLHKVRAITFGRIPLELECPIASASQTAA